MGRRHPQRPPVQRAGVRRPRCRPNARNWRQPDIEAVAATPRRSPGSLPLGSGARRLGRGFDDAADRRFPGGWGCGNRVSGLRRLPPINGPTNALCRTNPRSGPLVRTPRIQPRKRNRFSKFPIFLDDPRLRVSFPAMLVSPPSDQYTSGKGRRYRSLQSDINRAGESGLEPRGLSDARLHERRLYDRC